MRREHEQTILEDLPALVLLALLVAIPPAALLAADLVEHLGLLIPTALIGLVVGYVLVVSRLPDLIAALFSTLYGYFFVWIVCAQTLLESGSFRERLIEVILRVSEWFVLALTGGASRDNLAFVFMIAMLAWYMAYNAAWTVFGLRRLWQAVIPPGLGLLAILYYYPGTFPMQWFLAAFLFVTLALAARTHIADRERLWRFNRVTYSRGVRGALVRAGVISGALLLAIAWLVPTASASDRLAALWEDEQNPWTRVQEAWQRVFGGVEVEVNQTPTYYAGTTLSMGGPVDLSNDTVLYVYAPEGYRYYWRSKLFDQYIGGRWLTTTDARIDSQYGALALEDSQPYALRRNVQQTFEAVGTATTILYAAPQPLSFSALPLRFDAAFTLGSEYASVMAARADLPVMPGQRYSATSSISIADEASLRLAGTEYPAWVRDSYLQVPDTVTPRTRELAHSLAAPYSNPYDIASAVESYLRLTITYNERVTAPPKGVEPVDYVLFERQEGYCTYYASAMVVLLREVGIPARLAAGFARGDYVPQLGAYRVAQSDAHAWVEVFFPGYGWIEFEPTSSRAALAREGGLQDLANEPPPLMPTPTPTPALVAEEQAGAAAPDGQAVPATGSEGLTPDAAPRPRFRVPAIFWWTLCLGALGFTTAVFTWYMLELRGMERMSDVSRAYARVQGFARLIGLRPPPSATPYERAARISRALPDGEQAVYRITRLYAEEQYAQPRDRRTRLKASAGARSAWSRLRPRFLRRIVLRVVGWFDPRPRRTADPDEEVSG